MSGLNESIRAVQRTRTENPRTILAFYATGLGLLLAATVSASAVLAFAGVQTGLIPWLLGFSGLSFVGLIGGVFAVSLRDPSKLMLGQVTGTEYAEIQRVVLGDSRSGERVTAVIVHDDADEPLALEAGDSDQDAVFDEGTA